MWIPNAHAAPVVERLSDHIDIFIDVFPDKLKLLFLSPKTRQRRGAKSVDGSATKITSIRVQLDTPASIYGLG